MDDPQLGQLFRDAVEDVEPAERLAAIRQQTHRPSRTRWYTAGGAVLATAAAVTAIAVVASQGGPQAGPTPAPPPTSATDPGDPTPTPTPTSGPDSQDGPVAIYYVGDTPQGPRLFRYFEPLRGEPDHGSATELGLLTSQPSDPDYRTLWPEGAFEGSFADLDAGLITVTLADPSLRDRPGDMSEAEARLAVQQVVYTLQAEAGERLPVQFRTEANPIDQVFGVPTSEPITNEPQLDVLALVSITNPAEGRTVEGSFTAEGVASSFEGTVPWELRDIDGTVVRRGFAQGTMEDHLTPWATDEIDVADLAPGSYTFVAMTDDPSGGEGGGPTTDTRTVVVQ